MTIVFGAGLPGPARPAGAPSSRSILVFAMTGAMLIAASTDLLLLFLGLELMVLPGYLLAGFHKTDCVLDRGRDQVLPARFVQLGDLPVRAGLRVGPDRDDDGRRDRRGPRRRSWPATAPLSPGLAMGLAFLTTGVAFKIAAVPFHYWTPDAYQGSPTPITGYLSVVPKVGAFALILRLFVEALGPLADWWLPVVIVLATADDDPRQPGRADPGQRQADARLQLDRPHRLHAGRAGGVGRRPAGPARRHRGAALLRRRLHVHEPGRVRGRRRAPEADRRHVEPRRRSPGSAGASRCWAS